MPGGVGTLTIVMLTSNMLKAVRREVAASEPKSRN